MITFYRGDGNIIEKTTNRVGEEKMKTAVFADDLNLWEHKEEVGQEQLNACKK